MPTPHAIISGASIAGLSAAFWLRRTGWDVTVVERAPSFRDGGQNVDLRGVARDVVTRMGLFDAVKAENTTETGTVLVKKSGAVRVELPTFDGAGATAELEILRGDLARLLRDNLPDGVTFIFGETIDDVVDAGDAGNAGEGSDGVSPVTLTTSSGRTLHADLFVVAEGVRSSTRDRLFPGRFDLRDLGVTMVFGTIPRTPADDDRWRWHTGVGGRQIHLRPDNTGTIRAILAYASTPGTTLERKDRAAALETVGRHYRDAGWEAQRVVDGFAHSDDVYIDELTQVRMREWHRGNVVVIGDAAWCVTPMGGGGASLALTSGYVLAAFLARHANDRRAALPDFEAWMRPLVDDVQNVPDALVRFAYPKTRLALAARSLLDYVLLAPPLRPLMAKVTQVAETEQALPELP